MGPQGTRCGYPPMLDASLSAPQEGARQHDYVPLTREQRWEYFASEYNPTWNPGLLVSDHHVFGQVWVEQGVARTYNTASRLRALTYGKRPMLSRAAESTGTTG